MKILLDANISWRLAKKLEPLFSECLHVNFIGLPLPPSDFKIWNYAKENNFTIVSIDTDFEKIAEVNGFPPKVIILKLGNQKKQLELVISQKIKSITEFINNPELAILEIY